METKKFYEQPKAEVIDCELQQVLCSSGGGTGPVERDAPGYSGEYEED